MSLSRSFSKAGRLVDLWYARIVHGIGLTGPFFAHGWGDLSVIDFQHDRKTLANWPPEHFTAQLGWNLLESRVYQGVPYDIMQAEFKTPCVGRTFDALPLESRTARARMLLPKVQQPAEALQCVIHLAGTGDHGYNRRLSLGLPLLKQNIACIALESPYYGLRRPAGQRGSKLQRVSDLLTLGRATIEESLLLLHWAKLQGMDRLGMSGFSMGGVHASMVASLYPGDIACAPLLAPRSAATAYCRGALRAATAWAQLSKQIDQHQRDLLESVQHAISAMAAIQQGVLLQLPGEQSATDSDAGSTAVDTPGCNLSRAQENMQRASARLTTALDSAISAAASMRDAGVQVMEDSNQNIGHSRNQSLSPVPRPQDSANGAHWPVEQALHADMLFAPHALQAASPTPLHQTAAVSTSQDASEDSMRDEQEAILAQKSRPGQPEAHYWLEQVLEAYTDVTRYPRPRRTDAAVLVGATDDAYVDRASITQHAAYWKDAELRWVPGGHVSAFLLCKRQFRQAILDSVARL